MWVSDSAVETKSITRPSNRIRHAGSDVGLHRNGYAEERRCYHCPVLRPALVLAFEESLELPLQFRRLAVLFGGRKRVHRRAVIVFEIGDVGSGCARVVERIRVLRERNPVGWNTGGYKPFGHVAL